MDWFVSRGGRLAAPFGLALALAADPATAEVICRIVSAGGVAFGPYDVTSPSHNDTLLQLTVACDRNGGPQFISVEVGLGAGAHGASVNSRRMELDGATTAHLNYGLFSDVGRSRVWGSTNGVDTVVQSLAVPNKGSASATFIIYGRLPRQQDVPAGRYTDSVEVTVQP